MSAASIMDRFRAVVDGRFAPSTGTTAPLLGFLDTGFPEELAIAAGFQPVLLTGDRNGSTASVDPYLDLGAPRRIRHLYAALAEGRFSHVDALCVTGGDRWMANTQGFLEAFAEVSPMPRFRAVAYLDRVRGTYREHREYNLQALLAFRAQLEQLTGTRIDDAALSAAIALCNQTRELLAELAERRIADAPGVSGTDAHTITMAAMLMPKAEFNILLQGLLAAPVAPVAAPDARRIFISGSAVDHAALHEIIESLPAVVVGEDTEFGARYSQLPVQTDIDPMEALADRFTYKFPESWAFGREARISARIAAAEAARPDAEVFVHLAGDAATGWDFPDQRAGLHERGIGVLALVDQDYDFKDADAVRASVSDFVERIGETAPVHA